MKFLALPRPAPSERLLPYPVGALAFSQDGQWLYVSNLTLFLPFATGLAQSAAIDSAWTLQVQGYSVSRLRAKIPPFPGDY